MSPAKAKVKPPGVDIRIGMSGWTYPPWRGTFYPDALRIKDELSYASKVVRSIEINGTFYALQKPDTFANWYAQTPDDFMFSVKAPKYLTHIRRLKDYEGPLAYFFASGVLHLESKLGAILWQFPPNLTLKDDRFEVFARALPKTAFAARDFVESLRKEKSVRYPIEIQNDAPLHHAFEFRHASFANRDFIDMLNAHGITAVTADSSGEWPLFEDQMADFRYVRLHGPEKDHPKGYSKKSLQHWRDRVTSWAAGETPKDSILLGTDTRARAVKRIYVYFDNEFKLSAPKNAQELSKLLGL